MVENSAVNFRRHLRRLHKLGNSETSRLLKLAERAMGDGVLPNALGEAYKAGTCTPGIELPAIEGNRGSRHKLGEEVEAN